MNKGTIEYTPVRVALVKIDLDRAILNTSDGPVGDIENYVFGEEDDC